MCFDGFMQKYEGWCGVSYYEREMKEYNRGDQFAFPGDHQYYSMHGEFEEHVEIDKEEGKYEKIDVPEFAECKQATILHDFDKVCFLHVTCKQSDFFLFIASSVSRFPYKNGHSSCWW
jgi:hypothetical protein